jgi:hypothetical protein
MLTLKQLNTIIALCMARYIYAKDYLNITATNNSICASRAGIKNAEQQIATQLQQ